MIGVPPKDVTPAWPLLAMMLPKVVSELVSWPPMLFAKNPASIPLTTLPRLVTPSEPTPMKFPSTETPVPPSVIPLLPLAEMTLLAEASVPPMSVVPPRPERLIPSWLLATATVPLESVPMELP